MKKQILSFALVATMIGSIAAGCSSEKKTGSSDSTKAKNDSAATMAPPATTDSTGTGTTKTDTTKKDTTKKRM